MAGGSSANLEQFVTTVQNQSAAGNWDELAEFCRKAVKDVLPKNHDNLENVLPTLDLTQHTLGILAILNVKMTLVSNESSFEGVYAHLSEFSQHADPLQLQKAPSLYADLCRKLTTYLIKKNQAKRGILILIGAIESLRKEENQLTSVHCDLCLLCLHSSTLLPALPFLDINVTDISKENVSGGFDSRYFLLYYYYGGMIYTALKNYDRAIFFFEIAVTTPCTALSAIMVEAYKKFILITLIHRGKMGSLPKYTSTVVNRFIKSLCVPYNELQTAYSTFEPANVNDVLSKYSQQFEQDQNMGLARQVLTSLYKRNIQRLTKTFVTLSLSDVANRCQLNSSEDAEKYIVRMIEEGEIYANIDQEEGMVYFHDHPNTYSSPHDLALIQKQMDEVMNMSTLVDKLDTDILLNPQYVHRISKSGGGSVAMGGVGFHDDEGVSVGNLGGPGFTDILGTLG